MALNKDGMDLKAIRRDQKAIDKLPNKGRVSDAMTKAIHAKKEKGGKSQSFYRDYSPKRSKKSVDKFTKKIDKGPKGFLTGN